MQINITIVRCDDLMVFGRTTKKVVGIGVGLGLGSAVIGSIPGGEKVLTPMSKGFGMLGPLTTTMYAKDTMDVFKKAFKHKKK